MSQPPVSQHGLSRALILAGMLLVALNLRPAISSVPPLLETIRLELALSYGAVSLLTAIPVFAMGIFALATPLVVRLLGRETAIFWAMVLVSAATIVRIFGEYWLVLLGSTVLVGVGIAVAQTILPSIVNTYYANRVAFATGLYTAALAFGAALGSSFTVPMQSVFGDWTIALAMWGVLALLALIVWIPVVKDANGGSSGPGTGERSMFAIPIRNVLAWRITIFLGIISIFFFTGITWLPARYVSLGWSETGGGLLLTVYILTGLIGMLSISVMGDRTTDRRPWIGIMLFSLTLGALLIGMAPERNAWLAVTLFGIGSGGLFTLALMLPADFAADEVSTDRLAAMVFAGGYMMAGIGPFVIGVMLDVGISYETVFVGFAISAILVAVMSLKLSPRRERVSMK